MDPARGVRGGDGALGGAVKNSPGHGGGGGLDWDALGDGALDLDADRAEWAAQAALQASAGVFSGTVGTAASGSTGGASLGVGGGVDLAALAAASEARRRAIFERAAADRSPAKSPAMASKSSKSGKSTVGGIESGSGKGGTGAKSGFPGGPGGDGGSGRGGGSGSERRGAEGADLDEAEGVEEVATRGAMAAGGPLRAAAATRAPAAPSVPVTVTRGAPVSSATANGSGSASAGASRGGPAGEAPHVAFMRALAARVAAETGTAPSDVPATASGSSTAMPPPPVPADARPASVAHSHETKEETKEGALADDDGSAVVVEASSEEGRSEALSSVFRDAAEVDRVKETVATPAEMTPVTMLDGMREEDFIGDDRTDMHAAVETAEQKASSSGVSLTEQSYEQFLDLFPDLDADGRLPFDDLFTSGSVDPAHVRLNEALKKAGRPTIPASAAAGSRAREAAVDGGSSESKGVFHVDDAEDDDDEAELLMPNGRSVPASQMPGIPQDNPFAEVDDGAVPTPVIKPGDDGAGLFGTGIGAYADRDFDGHFSVPTTSSAVPTMLRPDAQQCSSEDRWAGALPDGQRAAVRDRFMDMLAAEAAAGTDGDGAGASDASAMGPSSLQALYDAADELDEGDHDFLMSVNSTRAAAVGRSGAGMDATKDDAEDEVIVLPEGDSAGRMFAETAEDSPAKACDVDNFVDGDEETTTSASGGGGASDIPSDAVHSFSAADDDEAEPGAAVAATPAPSRGRSVDISPIQFSSPASAK